MSRGHNDPRLIFSVDNIRASHLQNGEESDLTTSGPQTLSLLMVPTSASQSPNPSGASTTQPPEEDYYLHLHLPPEVELPLPATTQIFHQPPRSYLIPRWDLGPDAGAFTKIEFPSIGHGPDQVSQENVDTFETILAQCTAFLERSPAPPSYDPAAFGKEHGMGVEKPHGAQNGQIVLVDEENGSVMGELGEGYNVVESLDVKPGSKQPVAIQLPQEGAGNQVSVQATTPEYLQTAMHPAYAKSSLVQSSATASKLMVTTSETIGNVLQAGASSFTQKTKPTPKPMTFTPTTQDRIRKIHAFTNSAAGVSAKTVNQISRYAQNFGAGLTGKGERTRDPNKKPGVLNKSLIAISTLGDGVEHGAKTLLSSSSSAATTMVGHRYGDEARNVTSELTGGVKNVGLVYIDAAGVSRRAVVKSVAKGMVVGRMKDGQQLVVGGGDGGVPPAGMEGKESAPASSSSSSPHLTPTSSNSYNPPNNGALSAPGRRPSPAPTPPPPYGSNGGRSLGGSPLGDTKQ